MYKGKTPEKLMIPPPSIQPDCFTSSALPKNKRKSTFITQTKKLTSEEQVIQNHTQLIKYIDTVQNKVQQIIESHDSQFLLAYKSHLNRVRQEMQQLKNKNAKEANSASNQTEKIQTLERELIIFREQALKLFDKMMEKDKNIELLNMKIYELQTQQKFNKKTICDLMKRNKYLEALVKQFDITSKSRIQENSELPLETDKKKSRSFMQVTSFKKYASQQRKHAKNLGMTEMSFVQKRTELFGNNYNNQSEKQSRPTTTALGSKRNSISVNPQSVKSVNEYFARNLQGGLAKKG